MDSLFFCSFPSIAFSYEFPPERTLREADKELGWMFAPLPGCVEGVGCAVPIAGLISNFYKSTDLVLIKTLTKGDIEATVVQLQKFPLLMRNCSSRFCTMTGISVYSTTTGESIQVRTIIIRLLKIQKVPHSTFNINFIISILKYKLVIPQEKQKFQKSLIMKRTSFQIFNSFQILDRPYHRDSD